MMLEFAVYHCSSGNTEKVRMVGLDTSAADTFGVEEITTSLPEEISVSGEFSSVADAIEITISETSLSESVTEVL